MMSEMNKSYLFLPSIFEWMDLPPPDTVSSSLTVRAEHSSELHKHPELSYKSTLESFRSKSLRDTVALKPWERMKFQMEETVHRVLFGYRNVLSIIIPSSDLLKKRKKNQHALDYTGQYCSIGHMELKGKVTCQSHLLFTSTWDRNLNRETALLRGPGLSNKSQINNKVIVLQLLLLRNKTQHATGARENYINTDYTLENKDLPLILIHPHCP